LKAFEKMFISSYNWQQLTEYGPCLARRDMYCCVISLAYGLKNPLNASQSVTVFRWLVALLCQQNVKCPTTSLSPQGGISERSSSHEPVLNAAADVGGA